MGPVSSQDFKYYLKYSPSVSTVRPDFAPRPVVGPIEGVTPYLVPVAHSLVQAGRDIERLADLTPEQQMRALRSEAEPGEPPADAAALVRDATLA